MCKMVIAVKNEAVADFYAGKCLFLTGGTGFLGKVLIEKLLYSCPEIDKLYILIREKKGLDVNQRIENICDDPLFNRLKDEKPQCLKKIVPLVGDINNPHLGLSFESQETLIEKVSVVIHAAANVKFTEPLQDAWRTNVEGTRMILKLAQRMKKVEVFVHISTAYANTDGQVIEEVLYPAPADIDEVNQLINENLTEEDSLKIMDGRRPNTYTFTKAISEHLVAENIGHMPTIIIRPSCVAAIKNEPIKGWIENWFGATGIASATGKGLNRVFYGDKSNNLDLIPVDYVSNLVIAAGARNYRSRELKIYNCCSSGCNPVSYGTVMGHFIEDAKKHKSYCMPFPEFYFYSRRRWFIYIITLLLQTTPAYVADIFRWLLGKRPMFVKILSRLIKIRHTQAYYTNESWIMKADHTRKLFSSLSDSDKTKFPCDPTTIDWAEYLQDYTQGVRRFLEKNMEARVQGEKSMYGGLVEQCPLAKSKL